MVTVKGCVFPDPGFRKHRIVREHSPTVLDPLPAARLRHPAVPQDRGQVPGAAGAGASADCDDGNLRSR